MRFRLFTAVFLLGFSHFSARSQTDSLPFSIRLEEATWPEWPGLHSFAHGVYNQRWFMLYGRQGGMHGMIPPDPFPLDEANQSVRMFDPETGQQWERSIWELPDSIAFPLRSTNPQFVQQDDRVYVMGGYGKDTTSEDFVTFATLVAIDLPLLETALESGGDIAPAFRLFRDSLFYLCGGEAELFDSDVVLFGGHEFTGEYSEIGGIGFTQRYTNEVRRFHLTDDGADISISDISITYDSLLFHRRDLNLGPVRYPDGSEGLAAWSGVFQYDINLPWLSDLYYDGASWTEDTLTHLFNHYTCPLMPLYDSNTADMHTVLFGGISQYYFYEPDSAVYEDLNVPFTDNISCITRYADGSTKQVLLPVRFDALWGSNAVFIPAETVTRYPNEIIRLDASEEELLAGYLFGGIAPEFPNFTPSTASNKLYKVWLTWTPPEPPLSVKDEIRELEVWPNPATGMVFVSTGISWRLTDLTGQLVGAGQVLDNSIDLKQIPAGLYLLQVQDRGGVVFQQELMVY
ncbi:MAG TPA: hypothetical protein DCG22_09260 [Bacteroidetes bacterium]|nr:hypothetical protein [Bacteroidota bacterium]